MGERTSTIIALGTPYMEVSYQLHAPGKLSSAPTPGTRCTQGWVILEAGLEAVEYKKKSVISAGI
jgi:hypothetical protein